MPWSCSRMCPFCARRAPGLRRAAHADAHRGRPEFANWDQDETAVAERYDRQDPAVVGVGAGRGGGGHRGEVRRGPRRRVGPAGVRSDGSVFTVDDARPVPPARRGPPRVRRGGVDARPVRHTEFWSRLERRPGAGLLPRVGEPVRDGRPRRADRPGGARLPAYRPSRCGPRCGGRSSSRRPTGERRARPTSHGVQRRTIGRSSSPRRSARLGHHDRHRDRLAAGPRPLRVGAAGRAGADVPGARRRGRRRTSWPG